MARGTISPAHRLCGKLKSTRGGAVLCTAGIWVVKKGREDEFARRWQESADSIALEVAGVTFKLLRDRENPQRYLSLDEGWRTPEQIETVRNSPGFQDSMATIWRVLESGEMSTLDLVAEIS
jgi:heme-degrading monooxygenase HmoA